MIELHYAPISQQDFIDRFRNRALDKFSAEIYFLLVNFDLPERNYSMDNYPFANYDDRLSYCIALCNMLESLTVHGIQSKDYETIDPAYVGPLVNSMIGLLADTVKAIEEELELDDKEVEEFDLMEIIEFTEEEKFHYGHFTTEYEKTLDDVLINSFGTTTFLPNSKDIRILKAPLSLEVIEKTRSSFEKAKTERDHMRQAFRSNVNMNMFLAASFSYGLKPSNQVFEELYEALSLFNLIDPAQAALHNKELTGKSRSHAKGDYLRRRYNYLKSKGLVK